MLLLFLTVAQHEFRYQKKISWSETKYKCKKYPVNTMWLFEQNKCRIKKTLTGQRRNTIILKHLMFQSCDYPHFICISFRQFDCYIYIILWAPYRCLCIFTFSIHLLVSATIQINPISITAVEESFHEMRDKSY